MCAPILDAVERLLVRHIVHKDETHGAPVVCSGDRPVPLLPGCVPNLKFDSLVIPKNRLDLEVYPYCTDEGRREGVVGVAEEEGSLAHGRVANNQEFEHVVKVLVGGILLPAVILCRRWIRGVCR